MKAVITEQGSGSKVFDNTGREIPNVRAITIHAEINQETTANLELLFVNSSVEFNEPNYCVGIHQDVVALILKDGSKIYLPGHEPGK